MNVRLILAVISTLIDEIALVMIVLWALPKFGIHIPLAGVIALMAALLAYAIITYRVVSRVLRKKPVVGLPDMIGSKGKVVSPLAPEGLVKIRGELWEAKSADRRINTGNEVTVVGQDGLKLIVRKGKPDDLKGRNDIY